MKSYRKIAKIFVLEAMIGLPLLPATFSSPQEPKLIIDTDVADGVEKTDAPVVKEPNPLLSEQNVKVGNFYFKKKNYAAAIQRYLEAIAYKPDSVRAYEALIRAYEKNSDPQKAISACKDFLEKNPDSPKAADFRAKIAKLEKMTD
jgi:outer membrane protein assembly factor BamD (BamD/ComL family)